MVVEVGREVVPSVNVVSKGVVDMEDAEEVVASVHRW